MSDIEEAFGELLDDVEVRIFVFNVIGDGI
jgi:hypothetical protein